MWWNRGLYCFCRNTLTSASFSLCWGHNYAPNSNYHNRQNKKDSSVPYWTMFYIDFPKDAVPDWSLTGLSRVRCIHTGRTEHSSRIYFSFLCSITFMWWEALKYMGHSLSKQWQESIASIPETVPTVRLIKRCQTMDLANSHDSVHLSSYSAIPAYVSWYVIFGCIRKTLLWVYFSTCRNNCNECLKLSCGLLAAFFHSRNSLG